MPFSPRDFPGRALLPGLVVILCAFSAGIGKQGIAEAQSADATTAVGAELSQQQKERIRDHLAESRRKLEQTLVSPSLGADADLSSTLELAGDYLTLLEDALLGDHGGISQAQFQDRLLRLMARTERNTGILEARLGAGEVPDDVLRQVRAARERLLRNRRQLEAASALAAANRAATGSLDSAALLDRAQSRLDNARALAEGAPDDAELAKRIDDAQRQLDAARAGAARPGGRLPR